MSKNDNNLNLAVVPQVFLDKMEAKMNQMEAILMAKSESEINSQWIESIKIPKMLGVSRKTWQTYRDKRLIPFSQIGSKIYVRRSDLEGFMNSHLISMKGKELNHGKLY
jgi:hypothetical protein